ncbi:MAG: serine/threonine protein kinase [Polyangiaceae bacterium]|nr:serine/threonine protein kinase [Polyangiaceae bacterium]
MTNPQNPNDDEELVRTHAEASRRLEVECDFAGAAREALLAKDPRRAIRLATLGGDESTARQAIDELAMRLPSPAALGVASDLTARGAHRYAALLYARLDAHDDAAAAFALAGSALDAAESYERAGKPADAARALEAAIRRNADDAAARFALGSLLARHGRVEQAIKALQQIDPSVPERRQALPLLARAFEQTGLLDAAREAREEMERLGVTPDAKAHAPAPTKTTNAGGVVLYGRYDVVREIATSAHARLVEAVDRITGERVAVKIFAGLVEGAGRDALQRFEREARALERLRHPNVVPLQQYVPEGPAIVLAFMRGGSLADKMQSDAMSPARAVEIALLVLSALGEAHRLGILHRDVKPANVLFDDAGTAMLSDFGAAHLGDVSSTATAGAIGTYAYMAPEQRIGRPAEIASDLYAVGAILYELVTGEGAEPYRGAWDAAKAPSAKNDELTSEHDAVIAKFLAELPADRPADAFEARRMLSSLRWPEKVPAVWSTETNADERARPTETERLCPPKRLGDGRDMASLRHDEWLDREVLVLPLDDDSLRRARAFARVGHPVLPTVLRVDRAAQELWVAPPLGVALADAPRKVRRDVFDRFVAAIQALLASGGAHGYIDLQHVYWYDGELELAWPRKPASPDAAANDAAALENLARQIVADDGMD